MAERDAINRRNARSPNYRLVVDGTTITPMVRPRLSRLRLTDHRVGHADRLDLTLTDHDGRLAIPPRGAAIALALGWQDEGLVDRGRYIVDDIEHSGAPDIIGVRARSANLRQTLPGKRSQSWHDTTLGAVIDAIAGRHDLTPAISDTLAGIAIDHIDQTDESDMNFATRLGKRYDAVAAIKADRLLFIAAGAAITARGKKIPPVTITRRQGDQHRYSICDRESNTGVIASWNDKDNAVRKDVLVGSDADPTRLRQTYATAEVARRAARSEWQRIQRGHAGFTLTLAQGRPDLYPETPAIVTGFKPAIDSTRWLITQVEHNLSDAAYTTTLDMEIGNNKDG